MVVLSEIVRKAMEDKRPMALGRNECIEFRYRFIEDFDTTYFANFIEHKMSLSKKRPYDINKIIAVQLLQYAFIFEDRSDKIKFCRRYIKRIEQDKEGFFKDEPELKEGLLTIFRIEWDSLRNAIKNREDKIYNRVVEIESKINSIPSLQKEIGYLIELTQRKKKREPKPRKKLTFPELFVNSDVAHDLKKIFLNYGYTDSKNIWHGQTQAKNELAIAYYVLKQPEHGFQLIKTGDKKNQLIAFYAEFGLKISKISQLDTYTTERNILTEPTFRDSHDDFRRIFNTLAQTGTNRSGKRPLKLSGLGSDIKDQSVLFNKAKRKFVTQQIARELITVAKKRGEKEMEKSLWNTYYCLNDIVVSDHKIYGSYCKNRICTTCNSIRKAEIINKYLPVIESWPEPQLVTLTAKSCYAKNLNSRMKAMKRAFKRILTKCNKRYQRGKGPKLIGIKSLECNFNPEKRTYNPHFHVVVPNWKIAILLKREWLKLWPKKYVNGWAQDIRKITNNIEGLIEVVKYGSKIFTEPDPNKKNRQKVTRYVYISALYNILSAMRNIHLFDRFGFNLPRVSPSKVISPSTLIEYEEMSYDSDIRDWVNEETGETLTGYTPPADLMHILSHQINKELQ